MLYTRRLVAAVVVCVFLLTPVFVIHDTEAADDLRGVQEQTEQAADVDVDMTLTHEQLEELNDAGWESRAGDQPAVWVSVREQILRLVQGDKILWQVPCSTAAKGVGSKMNSFMTPLGWHSVTNKLGQDAPVGQVFRSKRATKEIWRPGDVVEEDLVLTRILVLSGEEPGKNKGGDVDSFARCIYIHGTNDEANIGRPVSHGCIRLTNEDVMTAFELIPSGAMVLITE